MKLKNLPPHERSEQLRKWKENMKVTCAECGETVRAPKTPPMHGRRGVYQITSVMRVWRKSAWYVQTKADNSKG